MSNNTSDMPRHANNFGVIRLFLAALVIIGHAPEQVDGNPAREPLFWLTGTTYLGGTAVFGFFLLSGYLITQSMIRTGNIRIYMAKRLLRIVPGFVVAYLISVFLLVPALGGSEALYGRLDSIVLHLIFLNQPPLLLDGIEPHYSTINGALWTISYEFRCYLLIALLWAVGVLQRPRMLLIIAGGLCLLTLITTFDVIARPLDELTYGRLRSLVLGVPTRNIPYAAAFAVGAVVYVYRGTVLPFLSGRLALITVPVLLVGLLFAHLALLSVILCGAVILFWLALKANFGPVQKINDQWDISYGTYLYGWPCAMLLLVPYPSISPWLLGPLTLVMALLCGCASWWIVERRFKFPARRVVLQPA